MTLMFSMPKTLLAVLLLMGVAFSQTPTQAVPKTYFGMHTNTYNDWPQYVGSLGKGTLVNWQYTEPQRGVFDWSRLDAWVAAAQAHGVSLTYANGGIPKWAVKSTETSQCSAGSAGSTIQNCRAMVANLADWDNFVTKLATRYKAKYGLSGKPLWDTEGGWAVEDPPPDSEKPGWLAKWYLLQWNQGVQRSYWYGWNNWRPLWSRSNGINSSGTAYLQVSKWMAGATMKPCTILADASTWTCALTRPNGYVGQVVWNAIGSKSYTPSTIYHQYRTLAGKTIQVTAGHAITITRSPIVLETF
jgi:hypothetical protein